MQKTLIAVIIAALIVSCAGIKGNIKEESACEYTHDVKMWALATIGIITEMNGDSHVLLGGCEKTDKNIVRVRENLLKKWWGIENRKELIETLNWLEVSGHRKRMYDEGKSLSQLSENQYNELLRKYRGDKEISQRIKMAKKGYLEYSKKSIIAWDYARYIALCGWGYIANYLSEDDAWKKIMPKAKELQDNFDSWISFGANYIHGRNYWSYKETYGSRQPGMRAFANLVSFNKKSSWNTINWNLDLSCK